MRMRPASFAVRWICASTHSDCRGFRMNQYAVFNWSLRLAFRSMLAAICARGFRPPIRHTIHATVATSQAPRKRLTVRALKRKTKSSNLKVTGMMKAMARVVAISLKRLFDRERFSAFSRNLRITSLSDMESTRDYHIRRLGPSTEIANRLACSEAPLCSLTPGYFPVTFRTVSSRSVSPRATAARSACAKAASAGSRSPRAI